MILVLKDLVRSDITGKNTIINLLFYFLENIRIRYDYEVNTFNGLIQEHIDCSRILAYYFLHSHDELMAKFCKENGAEFYRYVDDMSITVNQKVIGRKALKAMTESLRRLNLVSSIEKTTIIKSSKALKELFLEENDYLSKTGKRLINRLKKDEDISRETSQIQKYYNELLENKKEKYKNWIKILKRFYLICAYAKSPLFLSELAKHLIKYPVLFSDNRIGKYLIRNQHSDDFNQAIISLIDYLRSDENLYPAIESNLLETFLLMPVDSLNSRVKVKLKKLANDIFFNENGYCSLSAYARAIACLIIYQFDKSDIDHIAQHYVNSNEDDVLVRKYLVFVSLTIENHTLREKVLNKAKQEQDPSIYRLVNFIENVKNYKKNKLVKKYLKQNEIYIYFDPEDKYEIKEKYPNVRSIILNKLINVYE